ncbi:undecaprenyl-phosphate glucose phosphotransferase [Burkholderia catarinensis]|uniref:undecaprenyl-phosphate glucose phosphotransferase n=1 Tax=Burkholderia catarinensis TaxID=1108140 RepID=UPI00090FD27E|nr:undecaprenyl-phosphate glucose phosphotransferase [Burkholderia catarinensis]KAG8150027.1 undecaprenyl-phosphate glucose phosphotransferase [Burkholderia catarinensis]
MQTALKERWASAPSAAAGLLARLSDVALIAFSALGVAMVLPGNGDPASAEAALVASAATFAMVLFPAFGAYRATRDHSAFGLAIRTCVAWALAQACAALVTRALYAPLFVPVGWYVLWAIASGAALASSRLVACRVWRRVAGTDKPERRVAIVGGATHSSAILERIAQSGSPYRAMAVLDPHRSPRRDTDDIRMFQALDEFAAHVRTHAIQEVWIALPITEVGGVIRVLDTFRHDLVNVRFMPDVSQLAMFDGEMIDLAGAPAINLVASPLSPRALLQKAIFDRLFAAAVLIAAAPLLLAIAAAIKLSSPGPALFRQRRMGADGHAFTIYKFRTMRVHAEAAGDVPQATHGDPRVTRIGAFLRRTSLDELPQFINVLRGDMSVVGPRPHAIEHDTLYQKIVDGYIHRYRVKPGITGWAQINGLRGETDRVEKMRRRVEADLYYLRNWSFALDMRIVMATATHGWTHSNAY